MSDQALPLSGVAAIAAKRQSSISVKRASSLAKSKSFSESSITRGRKSSGSLRAGSGERTVKQLRLSKALTIPDGTTVLDACRRMAARRVDAALLTDSSALLSGIITDKDVTTRVVAEGLKPEETPVAKVMTRNPAFVIGDTLVADALQRMVQGKFRHLPVVENGEVVALLDITKCLYDAISRLERAAEKWDAIAAAVEGVEGQWSNSITAPFSFLTTLRERVLRPSLATIIQDNTKLAIVAPSDTVYTATKKMKELQVSSVIITTNNKPQGIFTSKDILMRVVSQNLAPDVTSVDKVMTANPECATLETSIVDALHTMHDGKFPHLPVIDQDGYVAACLDVLQLTHAAADMVGSTGDGSDTASVMMQKFWDSSFRLEPLNNDDDCHSCISATKHTGTPDSTKCASLEVANSFSFKLQDNNGRVHRFNCGTESLMELVSSVSRRVNNIRSNEIPHLMYEDDDGDLVLLATDNDLLAAVNYARSCDWKSLKLHIDYTHLGGNAAQPKSRKKPMQTKFPALELEEAAGIENWGLTYTAAAATAAVILGICVMMYLKRSK